MLFKLQFNVKEYHVHTGSCHSTGTGEHFFYSKKITHFRICVQRKFITVTNAETAVLHGIQCEQVPAYWQSFLQTHPRSFAASLTQAYRCHLYIMGSSIGGRLWNRMFLRTGHSTLSDKLMIH